MSEQINRIVQKLHQLKQADKKFSIFAAKKHRYQLNPVKSEYELAEFEIHHNVKLPNEYREFLKQVGNGGAGPYYGLEPLENGVFADLDCKDKNDLNDLSKPFPHTDYWNMHFTEQTKANLQAYEDNYFKNCWTNGLLKIANFGCGISINLVVSGQEYGNIWVDARCNDNGIYPVSSQNLCPDLYFTSEERVTFLNWYEQWLDNALQEVL